jgi:hypothetical protein
MDGNSCGINSCTILILTWRELGKPQRTGALAKIQTECFARPAEVLCYKTEGRRYKSRRGHWIFSIYLILPAAL